jgi:phosphoribosylglycinamide formyltransferase-1
MNKPVTPPKSVPANETFVGDAITPAESSFSASSMATGGPGLPSVFSWKGRRYSVLEVLEQWKETGDCRHGSGERYVRKHWFRIRTSEGLEMSIYFERQRRSSGGSRWRLYSVRDIQPAGTPIDPSAARKPSAGP